MKHPTEDQLILFHYREGGDRAAIEQHLAACESCRAGYQALERVLAAAAAAPVPERAEDYGSQVWQRLGPRLSQAAAEPTAPGGASRWAELFRARRWVQATALAALLLAAFLAGHLWKRPAPAPGTTTTAPQVPSQVRERILLVTVSQHLERSQMVLIELMNASGSGPSGKPVDISAEQQWVEDLVGANRLYRQAAAGAGKTPVASLLDELERTLLEIAHSPSQLTPAELEGLRRRIEAKGILFKVRVVGSQLRAQERKTVRESAGERL